ncbi:hypothetical protein [Pseudolabrys taiwanensis]|uniref:hypothetical protein n=1 Tax=Pseudolabrys taiwanensis TaxID=331696 RepID=UPI001FDF0FEB|nr:hypothetical protein [Pseudolabrys taiwanensis]
MIGSRPDHLSIAGTEIAAGQAVGFDGYDIVPVSGHCDSPRIGHCRCAFLQGSVSSYRVLKPGSFAVSFYGWNVADKFIAAWRAAGCRD